MRRITILGSTGSIGCNTVDLIQRQGGAEAYNVVALTGGANVALLAEQARALSADIAVTAYPDKRAALEAALDGSGIAVAAGPEALCEAAARPTDWAMSAIVGAAGLLPTLELARHTTTLALANKESLVCAGPYLKSVCAANGTQLLPVDSEHSAIFQAIAGAPMKEVERIILTASGGPFRTWKKADLNKATREQALAHPNWEMGQRITVDSATLFNKALEVIEAQQLFDVSPEQVEVVVHRQSIIHSMVGFRDGAIMAQLGPPDMRGPIGYALNYPERADLPVERLDLGALSRLDFEPPDPDRFPALRLAREAMDLGGAAGAVLIAAKEIALDHFLDGNIAYLQMADVVETVMGQLGQEAGMVRPEDGLDPILKLDQTARKLAAQHLKQEVETAR